jgi:hypothetical protein
MSELGADKHTSAGIMAAVHTPVVMVAGAAVEKAEKALSVLMAVRLTRNILMDQAVVEGATAVAVLVSRCFTQANHFLCVAAVVVVAVLSFPQSPTQTGLCNFPATTPAMV